MDPTVSNGIPGRTPIPWYPIAPDGIPTSTQSLRLLEAYFEHFRAQLAKWISGLSAGPLILHVSSDSEFISCIFYVSIKNPPKES